MSVSELTEWAVVMGMWADNDKAAMAEARAGAGSGASGRGRGRGRAPTRADYPDGIGPGKGPWGA